MNWRMSRTLVLLAALLLAVSAPPRAASVAGQPQQATAATARWADWVEPDFPFYSSVVDARHAGVTSGHEPESSRARVEPGRRAVGGVRSRPASGRGDVARRGVTPKALAPGSVSRARQEDARRPDPAPEPQGACGSPTASTRDGKPATASFTDPREPAPSPEEVGRGPIPRDHGALRRHPDAVERRQARVLGRRRQHQRCRFGSAKMAGPSIARRFQMRVRRARLWCSRSGRGERQRLAPRSPGRRHLETRPWRWCHASRSRSLD